jgi:N-acetyl-gamma-glutamyl-phosphate reductase
MVKAGVIGATGYAGAELVRLLSGHPDAEVAAVSSVSFEGKALSEIYPSYYGQFDGILGTQEEVVEKSDVIFAALPSGLSQELAAECAAKGKALIDMGADFRLKDEATYQKYYGGGFTHPELHEQAVYGLPEFYREAISKTKIVGNPGCYATTVELSLIPALKNGLVEETGIIADCKSGVTGSGRGLTQNTHYPEHNENMTAYKIGKHRHTPEIEQTLKECSGKAAALTFTPHLLPVNRGILATCYLRLKPNVTEAMVREAYEAQYGNEFFVRLLPPGAVAQIKCVRMSNFCDISLNYDAHTGMLIVVSALDNMVKGSAGEAIQCMNLMLGLKETTGLTAMAPAF